MAKILPPIYQRAGYNIVNIQITLNQLSGFFFPHMIALMSFD